jgi:6-phosphofructokinase 1
MEKREYDFRVPNLGECKNKSPLLFSTTYGDKIANYVNDDERILYKIDARAGDPRKTYRETELLELCGPRENIFFNPKLVHAGIVTCGGLCPGLNDVIRSIVHALWYEYGVRRITGIPYGYKGFFSADYPMLALNPDEVQNINSQGGTILGSSRGAGGTAEEIVDAMLQMNMNMLFTIGGDGTQKGAMGIAAEIEKRGLKIAVVGIPKTIDNDLSFIQKSFGFETAVSKAVEAVMSAHIEAKGAVNGIGLVKVMGRESGFIAAYTTLACSEVNFTLIPEADFDLDGDNGFLKNLKNRLVKRQHAVVLVAEGAGQKFFTDSAETDASGNKKLANIGEFLKDRISAYFKKENMEINLKYIDPSYIIRSAPANPIDSVYCQRLGTNAVHAAMAGKTKILISLIHDNFVHLPIEMAVARRNFVDPESSLWRDVIETTGQPLRMINS